MESTIYHSAISRLPQYWTSYSSFWSKITETCHALSREHSTAVFKKAVQTFLHHQQTFQENVLEAVLAKMQRDEEMEERASGWHGQFENVLKQLQSVSHIKYSVNKSYSDGFPSLSTSPPLTSSSHRPRKPSHQVSPGTQSK